MKLPDIHRRKTRSVRVGGLAIGGDAPITVQSMTTTTTADVEAKIRLNPGNITDRTHVEQVIAAARDAGVAIRVGVNEGSVVDRINETRRSDQLTRPLDELMVETLATYLEVFAAADFHELVLSAKSHDAPTCISVNRKLAERYDYPLHLGLTHAGTAATGVVRSVAALAALLADGIGDTVRISLAGDPIAEVEAAREMLFSLRLRPRDAVELIACPTCGRTDADVSALAETIRAATADIRAHVRVAVMGCVVNGPGEALGSDVAVCCGKGQAVIYRRGERVGTVPNDRIVETLVKMIRQFAAEAT